MQDPHQQEQLVDHRPRISPCSPRACVSPGSAEPSVVAERNVEKLLGRSFRFQEDVQAEANDQCE